jgi:hypothetical protein
MLAKMKKNKQIYRNNRYVTMMNINEEVGNSCGLSGRVKSDNEEHFIK